MVGVGAWLAVYGVEQDALCVCAGDGIDPACLATSRFRERRVVESGDSRLDRALKAVRRSQRNQTLLDIGLVKKDAPDAEGEADRQENARGDPPARRGHEPRQCESAAQS